MTTALAIVLVVVGVALALLGPWLARRLVWQDEGDRSSRLSVALGLGAGRWWTRYRLVAVELVAVALVLSGALALLGVWNPNN